MGPAQLCGPRTQCPRPLWFSPRRRVRGRRPSRASNPGRLAPVLPSSRHVPLLPREKVLEQKFGGHWLEPFRTCLGNSPRTLRLQQFEESQGRTSSKAAFYRALQGALGGEDADPGVRAAATWYYSLEHSAGDYASFSRALENATR